VPPLIRDKTITVRFWGNVSSGTMPAMMNCIDLLVMPSLNEGLPLAAAEALKCGAAVIGSAAGGIPEVIGDECAVPLGPSFVEDMAALGCRLLAEGASGQVPGNMDWNKTAAAELDFVRQLL
ncbi:MAG: glycosyltransferase, partial [Bacteroidales bacterium]|nr:glycosyltransferase [Bacteroidales bacterium]